MGRKRDKEILEESYRREYLNLKRKMLDPEFKRVSEELLEIKKEIKRREKVLQKDSQSSEDKRDLRQEIKLLWKKMGDLGRYQCEKYNLQVPIDSEQITKEFIPRYSPCPPLDIIEVLPYREPKIPYPVEGVKARLWPEKFPEVRPDFSSYLEPDLETGKPRYLTIKIDTWHPYEVIATAFKWRLKILKFIGAITYKSRPRLSTQELQVRAMNLKSLGKTLKEIASEMWPGQFEKQEKRIAKKENVEGEERNLYEQFVQRLLEEGKSMGEAYDEADKKFGLAGKKIVNPLIIKVHYLLSKKQK